MLPKEIVNWNQMIDIHSSLTIGTSVATFVLLVMMIVHALSTKFMSTDWNQDSVFRLVVANRAILLLFNGFQDTCNVFLTEIYPAA